MDKLKEDDKSLTYDMAVIGAGPAGMSAALYGARAGLSVVMFEKISAGGQLGESQHIDNYPGFPEGAGGFDLAELMRQQSVRFGVEEINEEVVSADLSGDLKTLLTDSGSYQAKTVVIATGAHPRKLNVEAEDELMGRGLSYCSTCDGNFFRGKDVIVAGGGNTAIMNVIYLARICSKVYLVHRRDELRATAVYDEVLKGLDNLEYVWDSVVSELVSNEGKLAGAWVENVKTGEKRFIESEGLFVSVGTCPNTAFLEGSLNLDKAGYIEAGEECKTSIPGVYVAGDVRTKWLRQVVTAVSDGAIAAEMAAEYLMS